MFADLIIKIKKIQTIFEPDHMLTFSNIHDDIVF